MNIIYRRKVMLIGLLLVILASLFMSSSALGYVLWGKTWWDGVSDLKWRGFYEIGDLEDAFETVKDDWDGTSTPISLSYSEYYFDVMGTEYEDNDGARGYCYRYTSGDYIYSADIYLNWYYLWDDTSTEQRSTANHEWGHSFGLSASDEEEAIMYNTRDRSEIYVPQTDDINGINAMY